LHIAGGLRLPMFLLDNWGLLLKLGALTRALGGVKGLKAISEWERYYLAQTAEAVFQCTDCRRPASEFARLVKALAEAKGVLKEDCRIHAERPRRRWPTLLDEYFSLVEDVVLSRACELAVKPVRDVVPEEEARALYQALVSGDYYSAYRTALYTAFEVPKWGKVLLVGAGTQEPLDFITACGVLNVPCRFAAMEVDEDVYKDLKRLAERHGFEVHLGWDNTPSNFDGAVVQNVLHWASSPTDVLARTRAAAKRMLLSQGVIEGAGVGFLLTYVLGAQRAVSWREVDAAAEAAGWKKRRRYAKYPVYIAVFA